MSAALSRYLKDFGAVPPPEPIIAEPMPDIMPAFAEIPEVPLIDIEALRQTAFDEGKAAAEAELTATCQAALDAAAATHQEEIEKQRVLYETEAAERIAASLRQIAAELAEAISAETAAALAPVMTEVMTAKAITELAALVEASILDGAAGPITVSGPRDLFENLTARLGEKAAALTHVDATDVDLSVTIGESVLVTRMSAWADGLRKVWA